VQRTLAGRVRGRAARVPALRSVWRAVHRPPAAGAAGR
jgi:hypothetical protein